MVTCKETQLTQENEAEEWIDHFLCWLLLIELCILSILLGQYSAKASFSLLLILLDGALSELYLMTITKIIVWSLCAGDGVVELDHFEELIQDVSQEPRHFTRDIILTPQRRDILCGPSHSHHIFLSWDEILMTINDLFRGKYQPVADIISMTRAHTNIVCRVQTRQDYWLLSCSSFVE